MSKAELSTIGVKPEFCWLPSDPIRYAPVHVDWGGTTPATKIPAIFVGFACYKSSNKQDTLHMATFFEN